MASVNYSVPDAIKKQFNRTFGNQNKSRIVAELMKGAIEAEQGRRERASAVEELLHIRKKMRVFSSREIRRARESGRP